MTIFLLRLLIVIAAVGTLHSFKRFRTMSRELDEAVLTSVKRIMHAAEDSGYPPAMVALLMILMTLAFMYATASIWAYGR